MAAFLAEPILGASAGAAVPPEDYPRRVREICDRHGVLLVADEVMTGFGRTGRFFATEWGGARPDLVTCGKGMSGGYVPVGAVLASERVVEAVAKTGGFAHGFTFSHNPVTAAACRATLDILERERLVERAAAMGEVLGRRLERLRAHPRRRRRARPGPALGRRARGGPGHAPPVRAPGAQGGGGGRAGVRRWAS